MLNLYGSIYAERGVELGVLNYLAVCECTKVSLVDVGNWRDEAEKNNWNLYVGHFVDMASMMDEFQKLCLPPIVTINPEFLSIFKS